MALSRSDTLAAIARLLSTSHLEKAPEFPRHKEFSSMTVVDSLQELTVSCPGLSLHHEKGGHCGVSDHYADRKHAEDHAVSLLARPLEVHNEEKLNQSGSVLPIARSARALLQNIYASFAVLVDSRLRAYTDFLARHAMTLSSHHGSALQAIEEKLAMILATGAQVEVNTLATKFSLCEGTASSSAMLNFGVTMEFAVPRPNGKKEILSISFSTSGKMTGTCR